MDNKLYNEFCSVKNTLTMRACLTLSDPHSKRIDLKSREGARGVQHARITMRAWSVARSIFNAPLEGERSERADNKLDKPDGASTKSHASGKIKNPYFGILRIASDVFFDADSESPHMT